MAPMPIGREPVPGAAREIWNDLTTHHVRGLSTKQQVMLVARACGFSYAKIGRRFHYSERGVRRLLGKGLDAVFVPLGLGREGWAAGVWVRSHLDCCLAVAAQRLAAGAVFDAFADDEEEDEEPEVA